LSQFKKPFSPIFHQHTIRQFANMEVVDVVVTPIPVPNGSLPVLEDVSAFARCEGLSIVPVAQSEKKHAEEQQPSMADAIVPCTPREPCIAKREIGWLYSCMVVPLSSHAPEPLSPRRSARQLAETLRRETVDVVNSQMLALPALTLPPLDTLLAPEHEAPEVVRARERAARARVAASAKARAAAAAAAAAAAPAAKLAQNESCCKALASNCKVTPAANEEGSVTSISAAPSSTDQSTASSPDGGKRRRVTRKQGHPQCQEFVNMGLGHVEASTPPCSDGAISSNCSKALKQEGEQGEAPADMGATLTPDPPAEVEEQFSTPPKHGRKRAAPLPEEIAMGAMTAELDDTKKHRQGDAKFQETVEPAGAHNCRMTCC